jgi:two-component system LytT family response regulator
MINVVIIDDEPLARSIVKEYLGHHKNIAVLQECNDGFEGVKAITQHKPDIIFLDIQMPKITGFEMLELIDNPPAVIFTTAFDEYAIKAFEAHAIDYLLKPFSKERFDKAIDKCLEQINSTKTKTNPLELIESAIKQPEEQTRVVVKNGANIKIIPVQEINYLEAYDDYVKIFTKDGYSLKKKTMNYFEQTFDANQFVRVHRSYMVQVAQITKIEAMEKDSHIALLKSGAKIPLSKSGYAKLKTVLGL